MTRFSRKMITQIDALTEIANEFSSFAKMPSTSLTKTDLKSVIQDAVGTFDKEIKLVFDSNSLVDVTIKGDENQLIRVFNNLLKNATQLSYKRTKKYQPSRFQPFLFPRLVMFYDVVIEYLKFHKWF